MVLQKATLLDQLSQLKSHYLKEGFVILGIFGSYARGDANDQSDIDILYDLEMSFVQGNGGFGSFSRLAEIRRELTTRIGKNVDIATTNPHNSIFQQAMLKDLVRV
jgi:hypothetical protein